MRRRMAILLASGVVAWAVILASACGGGKETSTTVATPTLEATTSDGVAAADREMLRDMLPAAADLPGFELSSARFLDNEEASAQAVDPAARLASLNDMGRITGFHAVFTRLEDAQSDGPDAILWSVNLFQQPSGALEFISQPPDVPEGLAYEPMDVSTLGADAVGSAFLSTIPDAPASAYGVAFANGVIECSLTTLYQGKEAPPDYTLALAGQARTLVEKAIQKGTAPQVPPGSEPTPTSIDPVGTPGAGGLRLPTRAEVGSP